jgi:uncharacterized protein DUF6144
MTIKDEINKIPRTGRIGRFAKIVETKTNDESFLRIMNNSVDYNKLNPVRKAHWWDGAIDRLEEEMGTVGAIDVMKKCGSKCCGNGQRKTAKRLMSESTSIENFLDKLSNYEVKDGELEYKLIDSDTIIGKHNRCFCGQVKKSAQLFKSNTYCQCSVEFNKQFFEAAFEKPVEVELLQSILNGDDYCEFKIKIAE